MCTVLMRGVQFLNATECCADWNQLPNANRTVDKMLELLEIDVNTIPQAVMKVSHVLNLLLALLIIADVVRFCL